ncbi:hypothetical protein [Spirosoma telluris]|uniref:hypothetical protein n=1 Tax=Spirosoma telluris TaxID=2183553 RepID=UPI0038CD1549
MNSSFFVSFRNLLILTVILSAHVSEAQVPGRQLHWSADGNSAVAGTQGDLVQTDIRTGRKTVLLAQDKLRQPGTNQRLPVSDFAFTPDSAHVLIFTNTARVWRYNTRATIT